MISILIPVYNYNVVPLVTSLRGQAKTNRIPISIHIQDDCSTNIDLATANEELSLLKDVYYEKSSKNKGRSATRNRLAEKALYDRLLFMDADMLPANSHFLSLFVANRNLKPLVFGGIEYKDERPRGRELRWKYGWAREAKSVEEREEAPYLSVLSGTFLIDKEVFLKVNDFHENRYGLDVLFTSRLKEHRVLILHIDNPALHCGLETNVEFLRKSELAMQSIAHFANEGLIEKDYRGIQKIALKLRKYGLARVFTSFYMLIKPLVLNNLTNRYPLLLFFDLFRLNALLKSQKKNG